MKTRIFFLVLGLLFIGAFLRPQYHHFFFLSPFRAHTPIFSEYPAHRGAAPKTYGPPTVPTPPPTKKTGFFSKFEKNLETGLHEPNQKSGFFSKKTPAGVHTFQHHHHNSFTPPGKIDSHLHQRSGFFSSRPHLKNSSGSRSQGGFFRKRK